MTNIQNIQTTQTQRLQNPEVTICSTNNKEVKFNYLPKDTVSISIRNEDGTNTDIKKENLPKELEGLTSPEKFTAFLKSASVRVSEMSDGESKVYVSQRLLGGKGGKKKMVFGKLLKEVCLMQAVVKKGQFKEIILRIKT